MTKKKKHLLLKMSKIILQEDKGGVCGPCLLQQEMKFLKNNAFVAIYLMDN